MTDPYAMFYGLGALALIALALDALIGDKPGKWGSGDASAQDVARIVGGGKPKATPRDGAKLGALWVIVLALAYLFFR